MTDTEDRVAPITCTPWCSSGDGHPNEVYESDQNCYSATDYVLLPLNGRVRNVEYGDFFAQIGVSARRDLGFLPCVHIHLTLVDPDVDVGVKFTPAEARWLAAELLRTADLAEPRLSLVGTGSPEPASE